MITDPAEIKDLADLAIKVLEQDAHISIEEAHVFMAFNSLSLHLRANAQDAATTIMKLAYIAAYGGVNEALRKEAETMMISAGLDSIAPAERKTLAEFCSTIKAAAETYIRQAAMPDAAQQF